MGRSLWWEAVGGKQELIRRILLDPEQPILAALPSAYLDAIAPSLATLRREFGYSGSLIVISCAASPWARLHLGESLIVVRAKDVRPAGGNVGQTALSALRWLFCSQSLPERLTEKWAKDRLSHLSALISPEVVPSRRRYGSEHARHWIETNPSISMTSASAALHAYRHAGYAIEQKKFSSIFREIVLENASVGMCL